MAAYYTLEVERGFLLNFQQLADDGTDGKVTQPDLTKAQSMAEREINARLGRKWDTSTWSTTCPPIVSDIAELIGSAYAWSMRHGADSMQNADPNSFHARARDIMDQLMDGRMDLRNAAGALIAPTWTAIQGDIA